MTKEPNCPAGIRQGAPSAKAAIWLGALVGFFFLPFGSLSAQPTPHGATKAAALGWVEYTGPHAALSIRFPESPTLIHRTTPTFVGSVETDVWYANSEAGHFTISRSRLPTLAKIFATDNMLYEGARDKLISELGGGRVISETHRAGLFERDVRFELLDSEGTLVAIGRAMFGQHRDDVVVVNAVIIPGKLEAMELYFDSLDHGPTTSS